MKTFTAYIEYDPETKMYIGIVPSIPEARTQGETLEEIHDNIKEVIELCIEEMKEAGEPLEFLDFAGLQQIEVAV